MILKEAEQTVFFGDEGCAAFLSGQLRQEGYQRILCVTGRASFASSGAASFLNKVLQANAVRYFSGFGSTFGAESIDAGLSVCREFSPDCIVGIGGGSVLDMAKILACFFASGLNLHTWLEDECSGLKTLPLIQIPTTAGSGSEATSFAVVYNHGEKVSVEHRLMLAPTVLLNPAFTDSLPPYLSACPGYDALAQAIESYLAVGSTLESKYYSAKALRLCIEHLQSSVQSPEKSHREGMLLAAHYAGRAINIAKTTGAHALSYVLTSRYGLPHGHAVALMLPQVLHFNAGVTDDDCNDPRGSDYVKNSIKELYELLNCGDVEDAVKYTEQIRKNMGLDAEVLMKRGCGADKTVSDIVEGVNTERMLNNPRRMTEESIRHIVMKIFE